jgi:hypothetical protein
VVTGFEVMRAIGWQRRENFFSFVFGKLVEWETWKKLSSLPRQRTSEKAPILGR